MHTKHSFIANISVMHYYMQFIAHYASSEIAFYFPGQVFGFDPPHLHEVDELTRLKEKNINFMNPRRKRWYLDGLIFYFTASGRVLTHGD